MLVVSAHPDDETIGAGRLLAGHAHADAVTLTAGEACVIDDSVDPVALGRRRLREWQRAVALLGARPLQAARWPDGQLEAHEVEVSTMIESMLGAYDVVVSTWRHDPHPDHRSAGSACARAAAVCGTRIVEFPVWAPCWTSPEQAEALDFSIGVLDLYDDDDRRAHALNEYRSQTEPLLTGGEPIVPSELLARHDRQFVMQPRPSRGEIAS